MKKNKVKLSLAQILILETIYREGQFPVRNNQNPTVKKMIALELCQYNRDYNALIFTELGKTFKPLGNHKKVKP